MPNDIKTEKTEKQKQKAVGIRGSQLGKGSRNYKETCSKHGTKGSVGGLGSQECPRPGAESDVWEQWSQAHMPVARRTEEET